MHYKITLEYDGTNYIGWQKQKDQPNKSVEENLQNAIYQLSGEISQINVSGRTDAGVHALGQVADFFLNKEFEPSRLSLGLNNFLRQSLISVLSCEIVADNFHSRYDSKMRHYRYLIANRKALLALQKFRAWHVAQNLDISKMREAASNLIGTHDFTSFRDSECQASSPIKTISNIVISSSGDNIEIEVSAKSFLHHMVRNIVGTLVFVGLGKINPQDTRLILEKKDRRMSGPNAPAHGLYFVRVEY